MFGNGFGARHADRPTSHDALTVASRSADRPGMSSELDARERRAMRFKASAATLDALRALGGEAERRAIIERALADGGFTRRELAAPPPPAAAVKFACMVDYELSWALTNLKRDGLLENPARSVWRLAGAALEAPELALDEPVHVDRLEELERMDYREYLPPPPPPPGGDDRLTAHAEAPSRAPARPQHRSLLRRLLAH